MKKYWLQITGGIVGTLLILSVLFANQLGLDNNQVWGLRRYMLLFAGIFIFVVSVLYHKENLIGKTLHTHLGRAYIATILLSGLIILIYFWYASLGLWVSFPSQSNYIDLQASAFRHGQIALEIIPDPKLITLEKEGKLYEPSHREDIPVLWDATLYKSKYYLYWGPAPAFLLAIFKLFYSPEVNDRVVTLAAGIIFFVFCAIIIFELWKQFFVTTPLWAMLLGIAFVGLANPVLFILAEARIYEAAIMAGQAFLMGGLLCLYVGFKKTSTCYFALAGIFFALAIGSRTTLVPSVALISLIVLIGLIKSKSLKFWSLLFAFAIPLVINGAIYAWYNFTRFGSFTEFGLRYQLTSYNLYEKLDETYSPAYIFPNTYKTLFNTVEKRITFPHIFPTRWAGPTWIAERAYPQFYLLLAESITGIFIATPFIIFACFANPKKSKGFQWLILSLVGSFSMAFITMQGFFFTSMRYLFDFTPALTILAVIGFWRMLDFQKFRFVIQPLTIILLMYSLVLSFILPLSGKIETYRTYNPALLMNLMQFFNQLIQ